MFRLTCHCGAVELQVEGTPDLASARRCNCSLCARRGAVMIYAPKADVTVVKGAETLSTYQFHSKTARHHFCSVCAIYTHHHARVDPNMAGLNAACIEGLDVTELNAPWTDGRNHPSDMVE